MNIQLSAREYKSYAEQRQAAQERKLRLYGRPQLVNVRRQFLVARPIFTEAAQIIDTVDICDLEPCHILTDHVPEWMLTRTHFDDHKWRRLASGAGNIHPVKAYIMRRAVELGYTYDEITGGDLSRDLMFPRHLITWEIKKVFRPNMGFIELGRHMNRDHSSVMSAVRKIQRMKDRGELD
jgi:hypothetical protein